jgi:acetyl-CoA acetyltransferase
MFVVASHRKDNEATINGFFKNEILPMKGVDKENNEIVRDSNENTRPETSHEIFNALKIIPNMNGHPVGNSGCRLSVTAIHELRRRKVRYALVSLCTDGGMAPATILERV